MERYEFLRKLAEGGASAGRADHCDMHRDAPGRPPHLFLSSPAAYGVVWEATDSAQGNRTVAIKKAKDPTPPGSEEYEFALREVGEGNGSGGDARMRKRACMAHRACSEGLTLAGARMHARR